MVAPALTATLLLANTSEVPLGYKAKTNAPRRWLVRPNIAAIPPGGTLRVSLSLLGPPGSLLAVSSLNEDRVLILSAPLEEEEVVEALEQRREIPSSLHEAAPAASVCRLSVRLLLQPPSALPSPRAGASSSSGSRPPSVADAPRAPAASPPSTPSPPPRRADASPPDATPGFAQLAVAERVARLQRAERARACRRPLRLRPDPRPDVCSKAHPPPHAGAADSGSGVDETSVPPPSLVAFWPPSAALSRPPVHLQQPASRLRARGGWGIRLSRAAAGRRPTCRMKRPARTASGPVLATAQAGRRGQRRRSARRPAALLAPQARRCLRRRRPRRGRTRRRRTRRRRRGARGLSGGPSACCPPPGACA